MSIKAALQKKDHRLPVENRKMVVSFFAVRSVAVACAAALIFMTGVGAAGVPFFVAVMVAVRIGVKDKPTGQIVRYSRICIAGNATEQLDASLCKGSLGTGTDTTGENDIHMVLNEEAYQSTMALTIGRDDSTA